MKHLSKPKITTNLHFKSHPPVIDPAECFFFSIFNFFLFQNRKLVPKLIFARILARDSFAFRIINCWSILRGLLFNRQQNRKTQKKQNKQFMAS